MLWQPYASEGGRSAIGCIVVPPPLPKPPLLLHPSPWLLWTPILRGAKLSKHSNWFAMVCMVWHSQTKGKIDVPNSKPMFKASKPKRSYPNHFSEMANQHANHLSSHPNGHSIPCKPFENRRKFRRRKTRSGLRVGNPGQYYCCVSTVRHRPISSRPVPARVQPDSEP